MGEMNTAAISANELVLIMSSIGVLGVIGGWIGEKLNIPDVVIYLILGVLFGPVFLNLVNIDSFPVVNEIILTFGSAFILYEGGREIKFKVLNEVKVSVGLLASLGVFITAAIVGLTTYYVFKLPPGPSLLLGATIASTDPAALIPVFKKIPIKNRLKQTVISESAFNDAFGAILFTSILTSITLSKSSGLLSISLELIFMILIGVLVGTIVALIGVSLSSDKRYGIFHDYAPKSSGLLSISLELIFMILIGVLVGTIVALIGVSLSSDKRYGIFHDYAPIISIVIVVFAYEISERLGGSGYMSVFVSGLVAGNKKKFGLWVPDENYVAGLHFRENIATLARMSIFIILGTVFVSGLVAGNKKKFGLWVPDENYVAGLHFRENIATLARMSIFIILGTHLDLNSLLKYGLKSVIIVLVLMLVARPIVVLVCTSFDRKASWSKNEKLFMMWVRETGVIPAALSGIIVSTKVPGYEVISSVVFDRKASWSKNEKLFMMWVRETGVIPAALSGIIVSTKVPGYEVISSVVFMTIIITLLVQASTTKIVAQKLDVLEDENIG